MTMRHTSIRLLHWIHLNKNLAALTYSAMHEQEGMIQLFAAARCPKMNILLHQIAESYLLVHASLSKFTRPWCSRLTLTTVMNMHTPAVINTPLLTPRHAVWWHKHTYVNNLAERYFRVLKLTPNCNAKHCPTTTCSMATEQNLKSHLKHDGKESIQAINCTSTNNKTQNNQCQRQRKFI